MPGGFCLYTIQINSSVIEQCQLTVVHFPEVFVTKIVFGDDKFNV
jgi:hypothetical protein